MDQLPMFRQIGSFHWEPFAVRLHEAVVHSADAHTARGQPGAQPWPRAGSGVPPRPLRCPHRLWQNFPNTHLVLVTLIPQQLLPFNSSLQYFSSARNVPSGTQPPRPQPCTRKPAHGAEQHDPAGLTQGWWLSLRAGEAGAWAGREVPRG